MRKHAFFFNNFLLLSRLQITRRTTWTSPTPPVELEIDEKTDTAAEADTTVAPEPITVPRRRNSNWVQMLDPNTGDSFFYNRLERSRSSALPEKQPAVAPVQDRIEGETSSTKEDTDKPPLLTSTAISSLMERQTSTESTGWHEEVRTIITITQREARFSHI